MSTTSYMPIFYFNLRHAYYSAQKCPGFSVEPGGETLKKMEAHRMRWIPNRKVDADEYTLYSKKNSGSNTPFIPLPQDDKFNFYIHSHDNNIPNFTKLPALTTGQVYYFRNKSDLAALITNFPTVTAEVVKLVPKLFRYQFKALSASVLTVELREPISNGLIETYTVTPQGASFDCEIIVDLTEREEGRFVLIHLAVLIPNKYIYTSESKYRESVFGVVDIYEGSGVLNWNTALPNTYLIALVAKTVVWKYWVVKGAGEYTIVDSNAIPMEFPLHTAIPLYTMSPEEVKTYTYLLRKYGVVVDLRVSAKKILGVYVPQEMPYSETPYKSLSMLDNEISATIISHLPIPQISNHKPEVVIVLTPQEHI